MTSALMIPDSGKLGPAMTALSPPHRIFVFAYCTNGCNATAAARAAGYKNTKHLSVSASRMLHRPDVLLAIREVVLQGVQGKLPAYRDALEKIAFNPQDKNNAKSLIALLNRGGLPEIVERNLNVKVTLSHDEKLARLRELAEKHNLPLANVIGTVTDAEFTEVAPADPWLTSDEDY